MEVLLSGSLRLLGMENVPFNEHIVHLCLLLLLFFFLTITGAQMDVELSCQVKDTISEIITIRP